MNILSKLALCATGAASLSIATPAKADYYYNDHPYWHHHDRAYVDVGGVGVAFGGHRHWHHHHYWHHRYWHRDYDRY